jgi:hypothetical protein
MTKPMSLFIEQTWFLWWIVAVVFILRWFHVSSQDVDATGKNLPIAVSRHEEPDARSQIPSRA